MNSVSAADTNIFLFDKKWWMLCNLSSSKIKDHNNELHLFSSKNPLSSDWFPHKLNPIILDSRKARNGGLIFDGIIFSVLIKHKDLTFMDNQWGFFNRRN